MAGKKRSGLANDRRAYRYNCRPAPLCPPISIRDIAVQSGQTGRIWTLKADTTILACQVLRIYQNIIFTIPSGLTLTNLGTLKVNGGGILQNDGTITNSGLINSYGAVTITGTINNTGDFDTLNITTNTGTINNTGLINITESFINKSTINNGSKITNTGTFENTTGTIKNGVTIGSTFYSGRINNIYIFNNNSTIDNNDNSLITNNGLLQNNTGGTINNNISASTGGKIDNFGIIQNNGGTITNKLISTGPSYATILNESSGIIYNYNSGTIEIKGVTNTVSSTTPPPNSITYTTYTTTFALFTNNGTFNNANGGSCGTGTYTVFPLPVIPPNTPTSINSSSIINPAPSPTGTNCP
jgi:hypothetical protein